MRASSASISTAVTMRSSGRWRKWPLVSIRHKMVPTPLAELLRPYIRAILRDIQATLETPLDFSPAHRRAPFPHHRFGRPRQVRRFLSIHDPINNLFHLRRGSRPAFDHRTARAQAFATWAEVAGAALAVA